MTEGLNMLFSGIKEANTGASREGLLAETA